jgi:hypothetical protein
MLRDLDAPGAKNVTEKSPSASFIDHAAVASRLAVGCVGGSQAKPRSQASLAQRRQTARSMISLQSRATA